GDVPASGPRAGGHGPDGHSVDGRDDRLLAVDHVVDQVAHLAEHAGHPAVVADLALHHREVPARGERLARAGDHHDPGLVVARDVRPHPGQLGVHDLVGRVVLLGPVHRHQQHAAVAPLEEEVLVRAVVHGLTFYQARKGEQAWPASHSPPRYCGVTWWALASWRGDAPERSGSERETQHER